MATFKVFHSLYPDNPKLFTIVIDKVHKLSGEPGTIFEKPGSDDLFWELRIAVANAVDDSGDPVPSKWMGVSIEADIDATVSKGIQELSEIIDWSDGGTYSPGEDTRPPAVVSTSPAADSTDVSILSPIKIRLKDFLPAKGIDVSSIKLYVDDFLVTPDEIKGTPFDLEVRYMPPVVFEEREDS